MTDLTKQDDLVQTLQKPITAYATRAHELAQVLRGYAPTTLAEIPDANKMLAPSSEVGQFEKEVGEARLKVTRQLDAIKKELMAVEAEVLEPITDARAVVEAARKVLADAEAERVAKEQAEKQRVANLIKQADNGLANAYKASLDKAQTIADLQALEDRLHSVKEFKCPDVYSEIKTEYLEMAANYHAQAIHSIQDAIAQMLVTDSKPNIEIESQAGAQLMAVEAAPVAAVKIAGQQVKYRATVKDWSKVDAIKLVAVLFQQGEIKTLEGLLAKVKSRTEIAGVSWVEEVKFVNR